MRKLNGYEYLIAKDWLATREPGGEHVLTYLGDGEHDPRIDKESFSYIGEMFRDDEAMYEKAEDGSGEYLHVADIDWEWVESKIE